MVVLDVINARSHVGLPGLIEHPLQCSFLGLRDTGTTSRDGWIGDDVVGRAVIGRSSGNGMDSHGWIGGDRSGAHDWFRHDRDCIRPNGEYGCRWGIDHG